MNSEPALRKLSTHLKNTIARGISVAASLQHSEVTPLHLLFALREEPGAVGSEILKKVNLSIEITFQALTILGPRGAIEIVSPGATTTMVLPELNTSAKQVLEKAILIAYNHGHTYVGTEHLIIALLEIEDRDIIVLFKEQKIKKEEILEQARAIIQSTSHFPQVDDLAQTMEEIEVGNQSPKKSRSQKSGTALEAFTVELTAKQTQKTIDPVIGREQEIERLIHILLRRTKNNPILVGEPGVGKTAIVEGLSKRIFEGKIPDVLRAKRVFALDLPLLLSGTMYRGEFEARLKQLIDEVIEQPDYILFIDELHNIIGAGSNQGTMDAANILKPALARGQIRCIGATTIEEYKKYIQSDPAFERRFQAIRVEEPNLSDTINILEGIVSYYDAFHHTSIDKDAIRAAVELSTRYIHESFLPDKAIDLLDEAAAFVRASQSGSPLSRDEVRLLALREDYRQEKEDAILNEKLGEAIKWKEKLRMLERKLTSLQQKKKRLAKQLPIKHVNRSHVIQVLANRLRIDKKRLMKQAWEQLSDLPKQLAIKIVGQDQVIEQVTNTLRRSNLTTTTCKKPFASFLFAGPSGVGKTALAKLLASELFGNEKALIKLDMGEFSESHSVSKILGSPAGYIGYKDRNFFTDQLRQQPYAVVLFDEIDKAHADVRKLLWQILDEGELTDHHGRKVFFHNAIVILTTQVEKELYRHGQFGFASIAATQNLALNKEREQTIISKLKERFDAALIGRLDAVCLFQPLNKKHLEKIITYHAERINQSLQIKQQVSVTLQKQAIEQLAAENYVADAGARHLERVVENVIHSLLLPKLTDEKKLKKRNFQLRKNEKAYVLS